MMIALLWIVIIFIILCNVYVAETMTVDEMITEFVFEKSKFGAICANIFYALAWVLKAIEEFIK